MSRDFSNLLQDFIAEAPFERGPIVEFVAAAAHRVPTGSRLADVGAGGAPYRELFQNVEYVTIDHEKSLKSDGSSFDVVASADAIPLPDESFDAVLCTQVLEHVPEPAAVLAELRRLLKPDGQLFVTVPLAWEEHELPFDFFRYTRAGIEHLLTKAGFTDLEIFSRGDSFSTLAQLVRNSRWSLPVNEEQLEGIRIESIVDRLHAISDELAELQGLDARNLLPLGYQIMARRASDRRRLDGWRAAPAHRDDARKTIARGRKTPLPILYIAPWIDLGGSDKGTIDWFKHIDRTRWAPSLITTQPSENRWLRAVEPYAEEVWTLPTLMGGGDFPAFILDFIDSRGIELVHIMNSRLAFDLIPDIKFVRRPPAVVVQLHAEEPDRSGYVRYVSTRYSNLIDAFSVTSHELAKAVQGYDVPSGHIHVIPTGVDAVREFNPELVRPFEHLDGEGPRILWPGRIVAQKDPLLTIRIVKELHDRGVEFTLHFVGDGDLKPEVVHRAADLGVAKQVRWHPPSSDMPRWYRSSDVLLMTSTFEGVPYVMYEACAMGLPIVVPALPGNVEFLGNDTGEFLIDPRDDVSAYADALERLLKDPVLRNELGTTARNRMLSYYSLDDMGRRHDALYETVLNELKASPAQKVSPVEAIGLERQTDDMPVWSGVPPKRVVFEGRRDLERSVAVIVPCFQHGLFLDDAITSILEQTLAPRRIVVVDDASADQETIDALMKWENDSRVRILRLATNSGPSVARNRALNEVTESYVLPLDADDLLLPGALADMVEQLERAPESVGFIYPCIQHFGNRHDLYTPPAYNLNLLLANNYCASASLFDRRVFDSGVKYAEDIVYGHEDWDLVLQMAERHILGEPATAPTFRYRKRGFSRVNVVDFGAGQFHARIARRHPLLFRERRDRIKAEWAPALSVVLLASRVGTPWQESLAADLEAQTCSDFELVCGDVIPINSKELVIRRLALTGMACEDAATQIQAARGRFVLIVESTAAPLLASTTSLEKVIRLLYQNKQPQRIVFAHTESFRAPQFTPLSADDVSASRPCAVAWSRPPSGHTGTVELGVTPSVLEDIVASWQTEGPVSWRMA